MKIHIITLALEDDPKDGLLTFAGVTREDAERAVVDEARIMWAEDHLEVDTPEARHELTRDAAGTLHNYDAAEAYLETAWFIAAGEQELAGSEDFVLCDARHDQESS